MALAEVHKNRSSAWPDSSGKTSGGNAPQAPGPGSAGSSLIPNVLVVDDDSTIRSQLVRLYTHSGYTVMAVSSAEEGLERLENGSIDFVITDIKLPGMSGIELIANMQENFPDVPVIAITGFSDIDTAVNVLKHGAAAFGVNACDLGAVQESTRAALEKTRVYMEIRHLRRGLKNGSEFGGMLSKT